MPMGATGRVLNEMCSSRVCVDGYGAGEMKGRIYNNFYSDPIVFDNVLQMLKKLDGLFNSFEYPQKTMDTRSFHGKLPEEPVGQVQLKKPSPQAAKGQLATFYVKVIFRKNATWQGTVRWLDEGREENFRSALELLFLMDGALGKPVPG